MRNAILQRNSALQKAGAGGAAAIAPAQGPDFAGALKSAVTSVNAMQAKAGAISESYERGETTDIAAVMLAREQSSVGFQATLQVRNKLLSAYRDIMSMPV
jgi:flagellar hook-basal body complex protein FliE